MNWQKTDTLNVPRSTDQWSLMIADDLLEARAYYDTNIERYYWQAVVGEVPVGSGETATLDDAKDAAQDALWKFFEVQRDFWFALTLPSPEMGEGSKEGVGHE